MSDRDRVLLINKPLEWTSFDVVNKLRNKLKLKKIGHCGTLDPLATGLLILCTGKMTKRISEFQDLEKEYTGTFVLGATTPSHDLETQVTPVSGYSDPDPNEISHTAQTFVGMIQQVPPGHSAIKKGGKRAYEMARKGTEVVLEPRTVEIKVFEITGIELPRVHFRIVCSKGTYIRSIARDFGQALGTGAYLASLCRTRIGPHRLEDALEIEEVNPETF